MAYSNSPYYYFYNENWNVTYGDDSDNINNDVTITVVAMVVYLLVTNDIIWGLYPKYVSLSLLLILHL